MEGLLGCRRICSGVGIAGNGEGWKEWGVPGNGGALGWLWGYVGGCQRGLGVIPGDCGRSRWALEGLGENWAAGGLRGNWGVPEDPGETGGGVPVGTGGPRRALVEILGDAQSGLGDREGLVGIPGHREVVLVVHRRSGGVFPMTQGDLGGSQRGLGGV